MISLGPAELVSSFAGRTFFFSATPLPPPLSVLEQGPACSPLPARPMQLLCQPQGSGSKRPISGEGGAATLQA